MVRDLQDHARKWIVKNIVLLFHAQSPLVDKVNGLLAQTLLFPSVRFHRELLNPETLSELRGQRRVVKLY